MLMYTSCGWFFDELSGIETVQVIRYAGRAFQLGREILGSTAAARFLELLEQAKSNIPEHRDGRLIYDKFVRPAALDLEKVGAHYAVSSLFKEYGEAARIFCYKADRQEYQIAEAGRARLATGRARLTSETTRESILLDFSVLHFGDHNIEAGVRESQSDESYRALVEVATSSFKRGDFTETSRVITEYFGESTYSLRSLFRDEQRKILDIIQQASVENVEAVCRQIYESNAPFLRLLKDLGSPPPKALACVAEFFLSVSLRRQLEEEDLDVELIESLLEKATWIGVSLDDTTLEMALRRRLEGTAERLALEPTQLPLLRELDVAVDLLRSLPFQVNLRKVQNICHEILRSAFPGVEEEARQGGKNALAWVDRFSSLCDKLELRVNET
jgi:hypothetical protein